YEQHDLRGVVLSGNNLSGWSFAGQNLSGANLHHALLTNADFSGAVVREANFGIQAHYGAGGISLAQLYSTASYQAHDLTGIILAVSEPDNPGVYNLSGADFTGQNLTAASFNYATLTGANFANAQIQGAHFDRGVYGVPVGGVTPSQIYSTASYLAHDL